MRVLEIFGQRNPQKAYNGDSSIARGSENIDGDTRDNEVICRERINRYKAEQGPTYMQEPRWAGSFVRAAVFEVQGETKTPLLAIEYNHVNGTHTIKPEQFGSATPILS